MYNSITLKADGTIVTENDKTFNGAKPSEIMLSGLTSNIQTQLDSKINDTELPSEISWLSGVTSNIQTQLDSKVNANE